MPATRRTMILAGAAALVGRRGQTAEDLPAGMITLSPRPTDLEMPVDGFIDEITPTSHFFVRSHTYVPEVKLADWTLKIDGMVDKPLQFTLPELKKLPHTSLVSVLECAGNGRSFYQPHLAGAQWHFGSAGNALWTGVRLRDLLQQAGLKPTATQLLMDGADVPLGTMPDFQRTLAMRKAMHPDTLLAWEMNGQPLTAAHGFPLRVVAPGWASDSWVKWLQHIEILDHDFDGFWMKTAYRYPTHPVSPGAAVDPKEMAPVEDLKVKSVIAKPGEWAKPGSILVQGVAWSNTNPVTKVEVSTDAGKTWSLAKLNGRPTRYGFRRWVFAWRADEGQYTLISRATNAAGETQPLEEQWNPLGYLWNVAQPRPIVVAKFAPAAAAASATDQASGQTPPNGYSACLGCHDDHMMSQQRLTRDQWDRELNKMTGWGARLNPEQRSAILDYLSARYKQ